MEAGDIIQFSGNFEEASSQAAATPASAPSSAADAAMRAETRVEQELRQAGEIGARIEAEGREHDPGFSGLEDPGFPGIGF